MDIFLNLNNFINIGFLCLSLMKELGQDIEFQE